MVFCTFICVTTTKQIYRKFCFYLFILENYQKSLSLILSMKPPYEITNSSMYNTVSYIGHEVSDFLRDVYDGL